MTPNPVSPNPVAPAPPQKKGMSGLVIALIVGGVAMCFVISCLGAIAVPNFLKFQGKAKQSEARVNLMGAYAAQKGFQSDQQRYSESPMEVDFSVEPGNRYLYAFSTQGDLALAGTLTKESTGVLADTRKHKDVNNDALEKGVPEELWDSCGVKDGEFTIVAAGNIDSDATVDVWSISSKNRTIDGEPVSAGTPHHHVDDSAD